MSKSSFLTSLQDLVFGLFGSVSMLVVVFSIFSDGDQAFQDKYLLVRVDWDFQLLQNKSKNQLEQILSDLRVFNSAGELQWELVSNTDAIVRMLNNDRIPSTIHFLSNRQLALDKTSGIVNLQVPSFAKAATVRTRGGQNTYSGSRLLQVNID
jgi:hypothetical protein